LSEGLCTSGEFLDCEQASTARERLQRSIEKTIATGDLLLEVAGDRRVRRSWRAAVGARLAILQIFG